MAGMLRTCFVYFFNFCTCACVLVEDFSTSSRGTGVRRSTRRVEPPVARRRNGGCRARSTYFQTSEPSLNNTASTSSENLGTRGERVWGREDLGRRREATSACPQPSLRYASPRFEMHATGVQICESVLTTLTLEVSSLVSSCIPMEVVSTVVACCMAASLQAPLHQISTCASAAREVTSQPSSPRYDTIAAVARKWP